MNPLNTLNPHPPTSTEIMALPFLAVVAIGLFQYVVYTKVKKRGYRISWREILRFEMTILKSTIIDTSHFVLLFLIMTLPLIGIGVSTELSVVSVVILEDSPLGNVRCPLPVGTETTIISFLSLLSLLASVILMHYFLDKYGAVYKLSLMYFVRDDIRRFLKKHIDIYPMLMTGFTMYVATIVALFETLVVAPLILSKEIAGMIVVFLLVEVLANEEYQNAFSLVEKIMKV